MPRRSVVETAADLESPAPAQPRAGERRLTRADCVAYAVIALLMLIWLFAIDGGMSR